MPLPACLATHQHKENLSIPLGRTNQSNHNALIRRLLRRVISISRKFLRSKSSKIMSTSLVILCVLSISLLIPTLSLSSDPPEKTVYEILPEYGLPQGLLPSSVVNYTLQNDGYFTVLLSSECYVEFDYLVYYDKTITGKLGIGSITNLKGIQVKRFLFWFDVDEIRVDLPPSDSIYFQVGLINKKLDVDQFKSVHSCRDENIFGSGCRQWTRVLQLPTPNNEVQMLITE